MFREKNNWKFKNKIKNIVHSNNNNKSIELKLSWVVGLREWNPPHLSSILVYIPHMRYSVVSMEKYSLSLLSWEIL